MDLPETTSDIEALRICYFALCGLPRIVQLANLHWLHERLREDNERAERVQYTPGRLPP